MEQEHGTAAFNPITQGTILRPLMVFFFPILFGTFFQQFYNTVDAIVVGRFVGKIALASVGGSSGQVVNLVVGFFTGLSAGASVVIAQCFGAKDGENVRRNLHTAYLFSILGGIAVGLLGILLTPALLSLMNTPGDVVPGSTTYLTVYFASLPFVFVFNMGSSVLRAVGDSRRPLYYLVICCIVNIVLDVLFVVSFHWDVFGVAFATLLAQAVSACLVTLRLLRSREILQLVPRKLRIHGASLYKQLRIGLPTGIQATLYSVTNIFIQSAINAFGTDTTAAWSAYGKIDAFFWMTSSALGIAITTFVGQNYGAGRMDRIRKGTRIGIGLDLLIALAMAGLFLLLRMPLLSLFTTDAGVIALASRMLFWITPWYFTYTFVDILSCSLRGMGDVVIPTALTLAGVCVLRIAWVWVALRVHPTLYAIILSYPVTWISTALLFLVYYLRKVKKIQDTLETKEETNC